jgi:cold shock CspA family protein
MSNVNGLFKCPNEECKTLISQDMSKKDVFVPNPIPEKDDQGRILSKDAFIHFSVCEPY